MNLTFKSEHIIPELQSSTAFQVIEEFVDHLVTAGTLSALNAEPIAQAIRQREQTMSTGLGFGVAIPHASSSLTDELILAFGRSAKGIDFNSLDQQPVQLAVLVITPARQKEKHFLTLAQISRLLHRKEIRAALAQAADNEAIASILNGSQLAALSTSR